MVRTREELIADVTAFIGENTSDEAIALLENVSDTIDSLGGDGIDWKAEAERIEAEWKQKYINRFKGIEPVEDVEEDETEDITILTFDDLFKEG